MSHTHCVALLPYFSEVILESVPQFNGAPELFLAVSLSLLFDRGGNCVADLVFLWVYRMLG